MPFCSKMALQLRSQPNTRSFTYLQQGQGTALDSVRKSWCRAGRLRAGRVYMSKMTRTGLNFQPNPVTILRWQETLDIPKSNFPCQKTSKRNCKHWSHIDHECVKGSRRETYKFNIIPPGLNFLINKLRTKRRWQITLDIHENNFPFQKTLKWNLKHWSHINDKRVEASRRKVYKLNIIATGLNFMTNEPRNQTVVAENTGHT